MGRPCAKYNRACRVFSACAGAAIYRREVFEEIGYFDEMHLRTWRTWTWVTGPE
ncbi:MAG: hypothetical protein ACLR0U_27215 [Enterocloster clostridioformis]